MKCEKCGKEYPSSYFFAVDNICKECFEKMSDEERERYLSKYENIWVEDELDYRVGFGPRLGAFLIDVVILGVISFIIMLVTGIWGDYAPYFEQMLYNQDLLMSFQQEIAPLSLIINFMYFSLEIILAATPGKMILGLQIASDSRKVASTQRLGLRFIFKHMDTILSAVALATSIMFLGTLSSIATIIIILGFFFTLSPKRQAFHDMLSETAVYKKDDIKSEEIENEYEIEN